MTANMRCSVVPRVGTLGYICGAGGSIFGQSLLGLKAVEFLFVLVPAALLGRVADVRLLRWQNLAEDPFRAYVSDPRTGDAPLQPEGTDKASARPCASAQSPD